MGGRHLSIPLMKLGRLCGLVDCLWGWGISVGNSMLSMDGAFRPLHLQAQQYAARVLLSELE